MKYLKSALSIFCLAYIVLNLPDVHYKLLRSYVGNKTVTITFANGQFGGGTGVHVQLPHGGSAILTNAHVCAIKDEHNEVLIHSPYLEKPITRRVISIANFTDLCLIEGLPGISGLKIGEQPDAGDLITVIGHPLLMPTVGSKGEVIGQGEVDVMDYMIDTPEEEAACNQPKNKILTFDTIFGNLKICAIHLNATHTTAIIYPGNSGSGVVDGMGRLIGLAFAGSSETHWGLLVGIDDIKHFLYPF